MTHGSERDQLSLAWEAMLRRLGLGDGAAEFHALAEAYGDGERPYHNLHHIARCVEELRGLPDGLLADRNAVETAIFFHDVVYRPHMYDNEGESAAFAERSLHRLGASQAFINAVRELILDTRHTATPFTSDGLYMADIDLAILGRPDEEFDEYEGQIRHEYAWVPIEEYRRGRAKILRTFLARPTVYRTEHFRRRYEAAARANLARSIATLESANG